MKSSKNASPSVFLHCSTYLNGLVNEEGSCFSWNQRCFCWYSYHYTKLVYGITKHTLNDNDRTVHWKLSSGGRDGASDGRIDEAGLSDVRSADRMEMQVETTDYFSIFTSLVLALLTLVCGTSILILILLSWFKCDKMCKKKSFL